MTILQELTFSLINQVCICFQFSTNCREIGNKLFLNEIKIKSEKQMNLKMAIEVK